MDNFSVQNFANLAQQLIDFWPIKWLIIIGLFVLAKRVFGLEIKEILSELIKEFKDLLKLEPTPRATDAIAIVAVSIVGAGILALRAIPELMEFATEVGRGQAVSQLYQSASLNWLLFVIAIVGVLSVLATR
jgi:uncharacterized membrane protein